MKKIKFCKVKGCNNKYYGKGYCQKHYKQIENHGYIMNRTRFTLNEIIEDKDKNIAYIVLYDSEQKEIARAIIDLEDVAKIKNYKWTFRKKLFVAHVPYSGKERKLAYYLIDDIEGKTIYYKNGNVLDCRKKNITINKCESIKNIYPEITEKCKIENCKNPAMGQGYCSKHYNLYIRISKKN